MTALNKQELRQTAEKAQEHGVFNMDIHSETVLALLDEMEATEQAFIAACNRYSHWKELTEAAEKRIAELTGKPAEEYADDGELLFEIDFCDDLSTSIQTAQWLKELRIRRAAGIGVKGERQGGACE